MPDYFLSNEEKSALELIKQHKALVKVFDTNIKNISFYLKQIADPNTERPSRYKYFLNWLVAEKEINKYDPKTGKINKYIVGVGRQKRHNIDKPFLFTKKTATSLLPTDPQWMKLFNGGVIGFLWDIKTCDLKDDKYIFTKNAYTNHCWWLDADKHEYKKSNTLRGIKGNNSKAVNKRKKIVWNEILACLPEKRIDAVFSTYDLIYHRLMALHAMYLAQKMGAINQDIPVLVITETDPPRAYTMQERLEDLVRALTSGVQELFFVKELLTKDDNYLLGKMINSAKEYLLEHKEDNLVKDLRDKLESYNIDFPEELKSNKRRKFV